jgi:pilus assembly protein CpaB
MSLRIVIAALMILTASALGMIGYQLVRPVSPTITTTPGPVVPLKIGYLAAAHALPAGTLTRDEDFLVKSVMTADLPAGAITDSPEARGSLRGALIRHYMEAGTPVTAADILRPRDRGFLAAVLAAGTRAVSVGVDQVSGVAGLIWPGDKVDVILTQEMDAAVAPLAKRVLSETVLTDVRVIAVDQEIVQGASATEGVTGHAARTVTLQVTADQAEKLAVAQRLGHLVLAIDAIGNPSPAGQDPPQTVFGADVSPALSKAAEQPVGTRVQVIEGDKRSEVTFH